MKSKVNTKAKILNFVSVLEIIQDFPMSLLIRVRFSCSWQKVKWKWKLLSRVWLFVTPWPIVHGILQARILEWVAFLFSRESSQPKDQTQVSCIADRFFTSWATREAHTWQKIPPMSGLFLTNNKKKKKEAWN